MIKNVKKLNLEKFKSEILEASIILHRQGMLAAADGNLSARIDSKHILITNSGLSKARMSTKDFAIVEIESARVIEGNPSSELLMHLEVFRREPIRAKYVIHAHPPSAIAWSIAYPKIKSLPCHSMSEVILAAGNIPVVPFARPGTKQMADHLSPFIRKHKLMILSRHGAIAWGDSIAETLNGLERLEHSTKILMLVQSVGKITNLPAKEVKYLWKCRDKIGMKLL